MLTLFTGQPGAGKTAAGVALILDQYKDRPLYLIEPPDPTKGRIDLKLPHTLIDNAEDAKRWHEIVPDGAVVFIPEVQRVWPPRGPMQKPTPDLQALETHRHRAIDLVVDSQHPRMVDGHVKSVAGRHIHIRSTGWLGRWWYEWPEISDTIAWKTCVNKRKYKVPKKVFGLYRSATEHIKPVRTVPPAAYWAIALVIASLVLVFMVVRTIRNHVDPAPASKSQPVETGPRDVAGRPHQDPVTGMSLRASFIPRIAAEPNTAPAYDHLRIVKVAPRIIGGYCQYGKCRCFTQQGTDPGIGSEACGEWIKSPPFDPYREPETRRFNEAGAESRAASGAGS